MSKNALRKVALAAAIASLTVQAADAMTYSYRVVGPKIVIDAAGEIMPNERVLFQQWGLTLPTAILTMPVAAFVFNSPGGNVIAAKELALAIRARPDQPNTGVAAGGECASACVLLWAIGARKSVAPDAVIGVHQVSLPAKNLAADPTGSRMVSNDLSAMIARDLASAGAPATVIAAAITTPPSSLYILTAADYAAWNVHVTY